MLVCDRFLTHPALRAPLLGGKPTPPYGHPSWEGRLEGMLGYPGLDGLDDGWGLVTHLFFAESEESDA